MDKGALLARRIRTAEVPIGDLGYVRVRGLTRQEMLDVDHDQPLLVVEQQMLALALVDPEMTREEIAIWQANSEAEEINKVTTKVRELSGIQAGAEKEAYKSVSRSPRP